MTVWRRVSQNRWPSLGFDLLSVNDLAAPFLGAGFYYKTFMWPRAFWEKLYEPVIRRAAGLGALSGRHNPDKYERAYAFCDLLVIGVGTGRSDGRIDGGAGRGGRDPCRGGLPVRGAPAGRDIRSGWSARRPLGRGGRRGAGRSAQRAPDVAHDGDRGLRSAEPMARWSGSGIIRRAAMTAHRWRPSGGLRRNRRCWLPVRWSVRWRFRTMTGPGIMTAGAVRAYLNRWGVSPGRTVTVFGNNDDAHRTAHDLVAAGVNVAGVIDSRADAPEPCRVRGLSRGRSSATVPGGMGWNVSPSAPDGARRSCHVRLPGHVGWLEPDGAPDLPHERPADLARRYCGIRSDARCCAKSDAGGCVQWRVFHRRLSA